MVAATITNPRLSEAKEATLGYPIHTKCNVNSKRVYWLMKRKLQNLDKAK